MMPTPLTAPTQKLKRSKFAAVNVAAGILLSRLSGLARTSIFAHFLGNSDAAGAFNAALRIPNFLQNLFGEGVLSASFVPVYSQLLAQEKYEEAAQVASTVLCFLITVVGALTLIGVSFSHELTGILAPGFDGDARALTETLVKIMFPGAGLLVLSAWCLGVLNSHRRFFLSYVAPVFWNIAMIALLLAFGSSLMLDPPGRSELVRLLAWSTVVGAGLQFCVQLPFSLRANRGLRPSFNAKSQLVRRIFTSFLPAVVTRGVVQISAYIDQVLASYLGPQAVSGMGYAQTLYLLPISLFGMSVTAAELPEMSKALGTESEVAAILRGRLAKSIPRLAFFVIPSAVAFWILGDVVVATLFKTGSFQQTDVNFVWLILAGSSVGLLASTQARLCVSVFWALRDTRTPMRYAMLRVTLTAVLGYLAVFPLRQWLDWPAAYSAASLTASAGFAGWIEFLLIKRAMTRRIGKVSMGGQEAVRCWIAAIAAAAAAFAVKQSVQAIQPFIGRLFVLLVYAGLYGSLTLALKVPTAKLSFQSIRDRLNGKS